ncbi:MAG: c-type cytochrome [Candidatus Parabeggiatoa sp.]|nr:c-type cytochrome [Candidatus Parabeggiatoa sp.]
MTRKTTLSLIVGASLLVGWTTFAVAGSSGAMLAKRCEKCHGDKGNSDKDEVPSIAGFSSKYFIKTMKAYKRKKRLGKTFKPEGKKATDMNAIAKRLNNQKLNALGDYFAAQTFIPRSQYVDFGLASQGEVVYEKRCKKCHEDNGSNPDNDTGILAGQWTPYLKSELDQFMSGERKIPKKMKKQLDKLVDGDIPAVLHFFASQQ